MGIMKKRSFGNVALACMGCGLYALSALTANVDASDVDNMSQRTQDTIAQLKAMETQNGRSLDTYELLFFPGKMHSISLSDRLGQSQTYYYMTFRLRNPSVDDGEANLMASKYTRYNEVLKNVADEYEGVIVEGASLRIDVDDPDDDMAQILQRDELVAKKRTVRLSIAAYDENGSRMRILDAVPGKGPQEDFNFADEGMRSVNIAVNQVRERIEEKEGQRLLLTSEIARNEMPMYRPGQYDDLGNTIGETHGVIIFDDLSVHGDTFEFQVRGLSNKTRQRVPDHATDEIASHWRLRIYRRTYYVTYQRHGDEYFRDRDAFALIDQGWRWRNTFQRVYQRENMTKASYFMDNLTNSKGRPNDDVITEAWAYYNNVRAQHQDLVDNQAGRDETEQSLPDLEALVRDSE